MAAVALLSHRFGNIGHNFMALGAEAAVREAFGPGTTVVHFEQHHPFSIYPKGHWLRWIDRVRHGRLGWLRRFLAREDVCLRLWPQTLPLDFNLAVACGGPTMVAGAGSTPEMKVMCRHFYGAFAYRGVPVIDAAVGSCFPIKSIPSALSKVDQSYYRRNIHQSALITVREPVARHMYSELGCICPLLPCIAIGSGAYFEGFRANGIADGANGPIMVNFQAKGSNDDWGQKVDPVAWLQLVRAVIEDLRRDGHSVVLLCHSEYEARLAVNLHSGLKVLQPKTEAEYGRAIAQAKVGFVSRIHAGVALAGIGVPSLVVGNDTRLGTTAELGLPSMFTKEITRESAVAELRRLIARREEEAARLIQLRKYTVARYASLFAEHAKK
jgi:hypothetical protein